MTDDDISNALQEVGAAWLMDPDDEMCQANALRHLVAAVTLRERERGAKKPLTHMQIVMLWGHRSDGPSTPEIVSFARLIEREHGIGPNV